MLTDFQQSKLAQRFSQLDADGDGFIQRQDVDALATRLCARLIPVQRSHERSAVHEGYQELWNHLITHADSDGDGQISREEYVTAVDSGLLDAPDHYDKSIGRIVTAIFHALDINGDGVLDLAELTRLGEAFGVPRPEQEMAILFTKLDRDGNGEVDLDELQAAVRDFYYGDDPDSPGAYVFGALS